MPFPHSVRKREQRAAPRHSAGAANDPTDELLGGWVWCDTYGVRRLGHRAALDGSPDKPICASEHRRLLIGPALH